MERLGRCQQESDKLRCECLVIMITQLGAQGATICVRSRHLTLSVCLEHWLRSSSILTKYTYIKIQPEAKCTTCLSIRCFLYFTFVNVWVKWVMSRDISLLSVMHVTHVTLSHAPSPRYNHLSPSSLNSSD